MKSWTVSLLAVVLLLALVPGAGEVVENVLTLAVSGHWAHGSEQGNSDGPLDSEHGCSGAVHVCGCHGSIPALSLFGASLSVPSGSSAGPADLPPRPVKDQPRSVFHPPRA